MSSKVSQSTLNLLINIYSGRKWVNRKYQPQTYQPEIKKLFRKGYVIMKRYSGSKAGKRYNMPGQSYLELTEKGINTIPLNIRRQIDEKYCSN